MFIQDGLKIQIGTNPQKGQKPVTVAQNSDAQFILEFFDEQNYPLDVTGATALEFNVLESDNVTVLSKTLFSGITPVAGYPNRVQVSMLAADFALCATGDNDVQVNLQLSGSDYNFNLYSGLHVQPNPLTSV